MLEDFAMEKKPSNRSLQTPSKGCGTEVKKTQDSTSNGNKQFPRQSRRREPTGPKWDQNRKSFSQKQSRTGYDNKRPKPRGLLYYSGGKANTQVVEELSEQFGLVSTSPNGGGKKQSLNHLLNFHYAPRGEYIVSSSGHYNRHGSLSGGGHHYYNSARWLMSTQKHKYNKEQFLQANCQFVVRSDGDYSAYMGDPDMLVDWDMIEQVRVISCEKVNCPICLCTPVAGKITRCGHVFCWSCMLHYLALSDKSWRKCPICYESVHRQDLKSVQILLRATHTIGEQITFRLMKREKGSLITSPVAQYDARTSYNLLSVDENELDVKYSKLLTADIEQVSAIIDKESVELVVQVAENEGCPELCFIEQAIQLLKERKHSLTTRTLANNQLRSNDGNCEKTISSSFLSSSSSMDSNCNAQTVSASESSDKKCANDNSNIPMTPSVLGDKSLIHSVDQLRCDANMMMSYPFCFGGDGDILETPTSPEFEHTFVLDGVESYGEVAAHDAGFTGIDYDKSVDILDVSSCEVKERCRYISASSTSEGEDGNAGVERLTTITVEDLEINSTSNGGSCGANKCYYFYQAEDGQQLFLHAVNVRMLEMSYGSLENSPPVITGTILEKESGSMTDELRKRLRYLQHLPVTCQFEVAEIDLKPPVISPETLEFFREQLETRKKRREKRARDERRREKKMVEQVHRQYGRGPTPKLRIESLQHFPQCGSDLPASPPLTTILSTTAAISYENNCSVEPASPSSSRASSPPPSIVCSNHSPPSSSTGPSFAQMLREGKSSGNAVRHANSRRLQGVMEQPPLTQQHDSYDDSNPLAAPQYRQSFSEAIASAFEQASLLHDKDEPESGNGKKKKRKQKVLLFATGMACNSK